MNAFSALSRAGLLITAAALSFACATPPPTVPTALPLTPEQEVTRLLAKLYRALETQEPERLNDLLLADAFVFGVGPLDAFAFRDEAVEALRRELQAASLLSQQCLVQQSKPRVGLAPGERSAWLLDTPVFSLTTPGKGERRWSARVTAHAVRGEGGWRVDALHVSLGLPDEILNASQGSRGLGDPKDIPEGSVSPEAAGLVGLARRMVADFEVKVDRISDRSEVALVGTAPAELYEGGRAFKQMARPKIAEVKAAPITLRLEPMVRARLAPDGNTGWVAANVVMRIGGKKPYDLPAFRTLWLFVQEGGVWNVVSEHQSLGLRGDLRTPDVPSRDAGR